MIDYDAISKLAVATILIYGFVGEILGPCLGTQWGKNMFLFSLLKEPLFETKAATFFI